MDNDIPTHRWWVNHSPLLPNLLLLDVKINTSMNTTISFFISYFLVAFAGFFAADFTISAMKTSFPSFEGQMILRFLIVFMTIMLGFTLGVIH